MELKTGLRGTAFLKVEEKDLSIAFNSGAVPVLATPRVVALMEEATLDAIEENLEKNIKTNLKYIQKMLHLLFTMAKEKQKQQNFGKYTNN